MGSSSSPGLAPWVIVAIPSKDDYVWKLSSEKIPHMTVLFLGAPSADTPIEHIVEYVSHVAKTSLRRFSASVERRGTLGPDSADVLFFENPGYGLRKMADARSYLLKDDAIKALYDNAVQYPQWTPHLTLGYPTAPAKEDKREYPGTHWVEFDTLALWTEDFGGIEFPLMSNEEMALAMSDIQPDTVKIEDFLQHHGIKGMRWGVRKQRPSSGASTTPSKPEPKKTEAGSTGAPGRGPDGRIKVAPKSKVQIVPPTNTTKPQHSMSDEELRAAINRINMERQYQQLTAKPPGKVHGAAAFVGEVLRDVGKQQAKNLLNTVTTHAVNKQLEKHGIDVPSKKKKKE